MQQLTKVRERTNFTKSTFSQKIYLPISILPEFEVITPSSFWAVIL